ncbi:MAG: hypothetical protein QNJ03_08310 [Dinoroseobacter sp.]|nr:hypothetical protein [Dinoroseobacter sp.]
MKPMTTDSTLITDFVSRQFSLRGSIKLHRQSFGWDLIRSPANVALAPVFLTVRLAALVLGLVGLKRTAKWLVNRRVYFRSDVSRAIEARIWADVIEKRDRPIRQRTPYQEQVVRDYTDVRNAISEIFTSIVLLLVGFLVFRTVTPGVLSLAPIMSELAVTSAAKENFPLGPHLGGLWYAFFPVDVSIWYVISVGIVLAAVASVVTSFAGVIADPLQASLGVHRRRMVRLLTSFDAEPNDPPTLASEHFVARLADLTDTGVTLVRIFRP